MRPELPVMSWGSDDRLSHTVWCAQQREAEPWEKRKEGSQGVGPHMEDSCVPVMFRVPYVGHNQVTCKELKTENVGFKVWYQEEVFFFSSRLAVQRRKLDPRGDFLLEISRYSCQQLTKILLSNNLMKRYTSIGWRELRPASTRPMLTRIHEDGRNRGHVRSTDPSVVGKKQWRRFSRKAVVSWREERRMALALIECSEF